MTMKGGRERVREKRRDRGRGEGSGGRELRRSLSLSTAAGHILVLHTKPVGRKGDVWHIKLAWCWEILHCIALPKFHHPLQPVM